MASNVDELEQALKRIERVASSSHIGASDRRFSLYKIIEIAQKELDHQSGKAITAQQPNL